MGLHCFLAHQHPGQLTKAIEVAIKNAQTKIFFSTEENPKEQQHFSLRRANHQELECEAPHVQTARASQARIEKVVEYLCQCFMTCDQVDRLLSNTDRGNQPHKNIKNTAIEDDTDNGWAVQ